MTRSFEQIDFAEELPQLPLDVSLATVRRFAKLTRMEVARFTDPEAARREGLPGVIVPGIMSQGLLVSAIHAWAPGCRVEQIDTVFRAPVLADSAPVCKGVVTNIDTESRTVEVDLTIANEAGETRVLGTAKVRFA